MVLIVGMCNYSQLELRIISTLKAWMFEKLQMLALRITLHILQCIILSSCAH